MTKHLFISVVFLIGCGTAFPQTIRFEQMGVAEGLSSNTVYCIFQDRRGFLWFGSLDGLNRYDGYEVKVYKHNTMQSHSLSNNRITNIYEDKKQNLWLYDEHNSILHKYTPDTDEFIAYHLDNIVNAEIQVIDSIYEDEEDRVHIRSTLGYELQYNQRKDTFELLTKRAAAIKKWHGHELLIHDFEIYLATQDERLSRHTIAIKKILKDSEGQYWIATKFNGLYTALREGEHFTFTAHLNAQNPYERISSEEIYDVYEDRSRVIWVATKNNGLHKYARHKYKFEHLEYVQLKDKRIPIGTVRAIAQDSTGGLWIGTNNHGLLRINRATQEARLYLPEPGNPHSVGHHYIRSLWVDPQGQLWIGHYEGFSRYRPSTDDFVQYMYNREIAEDVRVYDFKAGKENTIWMAGWDVILHFNPATEKFQFYSRKTSADIGFTNENVRKLILDKDGELWMGAGEKGMSVWNKQSQTFATYRFDASQQSLPSNNIFCIYKDSRDRLWMATADGLCLFDDQQKRCTSFTVNNGLPSNLIYGILEDKDGFLWLSTTKGISKFDPEVRTFWNYDVGDGLQNNEFTENAFFKSPSGELFFGGVNGINIYPEYAKDNPVPPQVRITSLNVFDKPLPEMQHSGEKNEQYRDVKEIVLRHDQQAFSIEFTALHYVNPLRNKYAYMLEGFDHNWIYRDASFRSATYMNLEPGTYYFKVKAANSDGIWTLLPETLTITIRPPFYATWWFLSWCGLGTVLLGVFAYTKRIETIKKQQSMKATQLESELNFLKSQINPHFLFNTLNNIYALCQVNSKNAAPMVGKISEMMRYMLYDCNANSVLLQKEIEYLMNYVDLNRLKSGRELNVQFMVEGTAVNAKIAPLLLINFVENSFKHSDVHTNRNGYIRILLTLKEGELIFFVSNSFEKKLIEDPLHEGIGLDNAKHRLMLLYPDKHHLQIEKNNSIFEIVLRLTLD